jgi:hypothetical protein
MSEHAQLMDMQANILAAINSNTEAVTRLAEALAGIRSNVVAAKAETTKVIEKAAAPTPQKTETPAHTGESSTAAGAATPVVSTPMEYKRDVAPTMAKLLAAKGAPAVVELLATFGVKKGADLPADKLADALAAATTQLAA